MPFLPAPTSAAELGGSFFGHLSRSIAGNKKTNKHPPKAPTSKLTNPLNQKKNAADNLVANLSNLSTNP
jgi:hypothetical protein